MSRRRAASVGAAASGPWTLVGRKTYQGDNLSFASGFSLTSLTGGIASAPAEDDVIVIGVVGADTDAGHDLDVDNTSPVSTSVSSGATIKGNGTRDCTMDLQAYRAGASPPTSVTINNNFDGDSGASIIFIEVWRGIDTTTGEDVSRVEASGTNTGRPNPGSITPTTTDALVFVLMGGSAATGSTPSVLTSSDFDTFTTAAQAGTNYASCSAAIGVFQWSSGAFDPSQCGGGSSSTSDAWAAISVALRPA